jgi:hypothetical protein
MATSQEIDRRLFEQIRDKLFTSIISDALDSAGFRNQAMSSKIRPIDDALILVGRARTASFMEVWHHEEGTNPYVRIRLGLALGENYCLQRHKPEVRLGLLWMAVLEMFVQFVP